MIDDDDDPDGGCGKGDFWAGLGERGKGQGRPGQRLACLEPAGVFRALRPVQYITCGRTVDASRNG